MNARFLAIAVLLALFSVVSYADSVCAAGSFASVLGTSCTIGDKLFTFSGVPSSDIRSPGVGGTVAASVLTFAPESTATSSGFEITGFPGTTSTFVDFYDYFTAVPSSGSIMSSTATLNGVSQESATSNQDSFAFLNDFTGTGAFDEYHSISGTTTHVQVAGGPESSFGTGALGGYFELVNISENVTGSTSFTSVDFVFNESTTVPEGSELGMLGLSALAIMGAMTKRFLVAR